MALHSRNVYMGTKSLPPEEEQSARLPTRVDAGQQSSRK